MVSRKIISPAGTVSSGVKLDLQLHRCRNCASKSALRTAACAPPTPHAPPAPAAAVTAATAKEKVLAAPTATRTATATRALQATPKQTATRAPPPPRACATPLARCLEGWRGVAVSTGQCCAATGGASSGRGSTIK